MAEIIHVYKEHLPRLRFIGKRYTNADRTSGGFGEKWGEWFQKGWFEVLEKLGRAENIEKGYLGLTRCNNHDKENTLEYWIGMFLPPDTVAPEGYGFIDLDEGDVGVCWIKGREDDGSIFGMYDACIAKFQENGMEHFRRDDEYRVCVFDRFNHPRFTEKDEEGNAVLDYGIYLTDPNVCKQPIEDAINTRLQGSSQKNALEFVGFLRTNGLSFDSNGDGEGWAVGGTVGNSVGFMLVNGAAQGPWTIWFNSCDFKEDDSIDDALKAVAWKHASKCGRCHAGWETCGGGERTIFGKRFEWLCHSPLMFVNPETETLESVKKLILMLA